MDVTLVENAEHNINRRQRRKDQERLAGQRCLKRLEGPGKAAVDSSRHSHMLLHVPDSFYRITQRNARREVERQCHRRELALMIYSDWRGRWLLMRDGAQRDHGTTVRRAQVKGSAPFRALP